MTPRLVWTAAVAAVLALGAVCTPAQGTETVRTKSGYVVRATVDDDRVVEDDGFVHVTGRVTPSAVGEGVILQQRRGTGPWKKADWSPIRDGGTFSLLDFPTTPGVRHYRVVKPASRGVAAGTSAPMRVVVLDYEWRSLLGTEVALANLTRDPVDVLGTRQEGRLTLTDPSQTGLAEYDLGGRCALIKVGAGMAARSAIDSRGWIARTDDGVEDAFTVYDSDDGTWGSAAIIENVATGTRRLQLLFHATETPRGYPSLTGVKAFCRA